MMISLDRAGKLKGLKGLLIGGMTAMKDHEIPFGSTVEEIVLAVCEKYNFPIYFNFPAGHLDFNFALKLQCPVKITSKNDSVHFQQT
jgi:muramoyltetrapeptide carboxypeptidase